MALIKQSAVHDVHGIPEAQKARIKDFLQGAVYCWCKNRPDEWFSMRDLMGGANTNWSGTPLHALYVSHLDAGDTDTVASEKAGQESGRLLKRVIADDSRMFDTTEEDLIRKYLWLSNS